MDFLTSLSCYIACQPSHALLTYPCCACLPVLVPRQPVSHSWASQQLSAQLQTTVQQPTATTAASNSPSATPPGSTKILSISNWLSTALQPLCWTLLVPSVLQCMPLHDVLRQLQDSLSTAAGSVNGLAQMCEMVAAVSLCGCGAEASEAVSCAAPACPQDVPRDLQPVSSMAHLQWQHHGAYRFDSSRWYRVRLGVHVWLRRCQRACQQA